MTIAKKALFAVAVLSTAVVISACRREVPEPNGLGAKDLAVTQSVAK